VVELACLLASELLTNAHLHTRGPYALRVVRMESGGSGAPYGIRTRAFRTGSVPSPP